MEKALVLRLLIYGIITQVGDKEHACGSSGNAATFRRSDGITIVCLQLPSERGVTKLNNLPSSVHGITLHITPNQGKSDSGGDDGGFSRVDLNNKIVRIDSEDKNRKSGQKNLPPQSDDYVNSTTTVPIELEGTKNHKPKSNSETNKSKPKKIMPKEEEIEEEEEEEANIDDSDIRNKRKVKQDEMKLKALKMPNNSHNNKPTKVKERLKKSAVEYDDIPSEGEEEDEVTDSNPKAPKPKSKLKPKFQMEQNNDSPAKNSIKLSKEKKGQNKDQTVTMADLQDILGTENDDEVEQYILIRRRRKKKSDNNTNNNLNSDNDSYNKEIMLPLASFTVAGTNTAYRRRRNTDKKDNKKFRQRNIKSVDDDNDDHGEKIIDGKTDAQNNDVQWDKTTIFNHDDDDDDGVNGVQKDKQSEIKRRKKKEEKISD